MTTITKMNDAIREAEKAPESDSCKEHLLRARTILANAVIADESLDRTGLEKILVRAGSRGRQLMRTLGRPGIPWASFVGALADYLENGGVPMPDGRVAVAGGWNTENCPPDGTRLLGS